MTRWTLTIAVVLASMAAATAGPLNWNYSITFKAAGDAPTILLGNETWWEYDPSSHSEKGTNYNLLLDVGTGWTRTGTVSAGGTEKPFGFGHGDWRLSETLPSEPYSDGQFVLTMAFTDEAGNVGSISPQLGSIHAAGLTTGTGNFNIGLYDYQEVTVGGRRARVLFAASPSESVNRIAFEVTELAPAGVPEPGTIILGGIAIAGGLGAWVRRRMAKAG